MRVRCYTSMAQAVRFGDASELSGSAAAGENHRQLFRRNHFELVIGAVARLLVRAPSTKLRCMTETIALHVIVSDFDDQFGT